MKIIFSSYAWEDYLYWEKNNKGILKKIDTLIKEMKLEPYKGVGEPTALKYKWKNYYSRRINLQHRLVYKVEKDIVYLVQCRYMH